MLAHSCVGVLLLIVLAIDPWPFKGEDFQYSDCCCHRVPDSFSDFPFLAFFFGSVSAAFEEVSAMVDSDTRQSSELKMTRISRTGRPS